MTGGWGCKGTLSIFGGREGWKNLLQRKPAINEEENDDPPLVMGNLDCEREVEEIGRRVHD